MIKEKIKENINNLSRLLEDDSLLELVSGTAELISKAVKSGGKLMVCGNGGSAADSQHVAGEFLCRFLKDRAPMPAIALSTDTSTLTAISNDYSFADVFARQVKALGKPGDVLMGISTSGSSENILKAFNEARKLGIKTVLLTGAKKRSIADVSDFVISVPSESTPRIQEMHLFIEHIICELVEKAVNG